MQTQHSTYRRTGIGSNSRPARLYAPLHAMPANNNNSLISFNFSCVPSHDSFEHCNYSSALMQRFVCIIL